MLQRDQFELLSAYLDGEVTATERRQVEELLRDDDKTQQLYARLLKLREGFQGMPLTASQPVKDTVDQVMRRLDQRAAPRRRTWVIGGAIAAAAVAVVGGLFGESPVLQFANDPVPGSTASIEPVSPEPASTEPASTEIGSTEVGSTEVGSTEPLKEEVIFRPDEMAIAASPEAIIAVIEPQLPTDQLMIGIDQPLIGADGIEGEFTPMPPAERGIN